MKSIRILYASHPSRWELHIVDGHGLIREEVKLTKDKVAALIEQINKASDQGAPWPKFTPKGNAK